MLYDEYKSPYKKESSAPQPKPDKTNPPKKKNSGRFLLTVIILSFFILTGAAAGIFFAYVQEVPEVADLKNYRPSLSTAVYDINNNQISQFYSEKRTIVMLADIPVNLQNAVMAKEDPRFHQHNGFDVKGILRAAVNNTLHGKVVEGGSTITQQLATSIFLSRERRFTRKIKELILSLQIEKYYTKQEILELYFNQIYLGNGAYGVEAAARSYFGKHANELNLEECAMLAALPQAPSRYDPYKNYDLAKEKRDIVIQKMAQRGYISDEQKEAAIAAPIALSRVEVQNAPYFVEYIRQQLEAKYGSSTIYKSGLRVYTTLDLEMQETAQLVFNDHMKKLQAKVEKIKGMPLDADSPLQGALIAMDPHTGHIKALIGGVDFGKSEFNRAVQAKRQTGSAFKPIVYSAAIDSGYRVSDIIMDSPIVYKNEDGTDWKPENFSGKFTGPMIILNGLTYSKNVVTVRLLEKLGTATAARYARKLGITSPLSKDLTLGLGSSSLSLLEMVNAFTPFANSGIRPDPISILSVKDSNSKTLEQNNPALTQSVTPSTAYIVTFMLENVINKGTAKIIRNLGFQGACAGKTGTTNDFTDAWFIGYTPELVVGIWVGFDAKNSMGKNMTGGSVCAPMWTDFMLKVFGSSRNEFPVPDKLVFKNICIRSGRLAVKKCSETVDAPFVEGTEPAQDCQIHSGINMNDFINEDFDSFDNWDEEESGQVEDTSSADSVSRKVRSTKSVTGTPVSKPAKTEPPPPPQEDEGLGF